MKTRKTTLQKLVGRLRDESGYSMIELAVVIVVITLLVGAATPVWFNNMDEGVLSNMQRDLNTAQMQLVQHKKDFGQFPTSVQATGAPSATAMTMTSSPDNGIRVVSSSPTAITLRVRSTKLRTHECTLTITYGTNARPVCAELATAWTGADPAT